MSRTTGEGWYLVEFMGQRTVAKLSSCVWYVDGHPGWCDFDDVVIKQLLVNKDGDLHSDKCLCSSVIEKVGLAVGRYHLALDNRQHGGIAANNLVNEVMDILDMPWNSGLAKSKLGVYLSKNDIQAK